MFSFCHIAVLSLKCLILQVLVLLCNHGEIWVPCFIIHQTCMPSSRSIWKSFWNIWNDQPEAPPWESFLFLFSLWFKSDHLDCNTLTHNREQKIFPIEVSLRTCTKPRGGQGVIIRGYPLFWIFVKKQWNYQHSFNLEDDPQFFFLILHPPLILTCIGVCSKGAWVGIALCYVNDSPSKDN